ncbi:Methylmalonyl-CoA mutase [Methylocella silvestris BL2]|uniref:Methylmalonyl-CoA mutase n=1 Tax=Methylocella silvestris (strain DSM 15510 / CIP 108128 / LMG 27833 / NCIMB 13906 / BL2) TaxID=395965 RepID=B8EJH5_METSB|nr:methylmalonyl-CoA mutase family protein [Methylocella silvestris]ACK52667.1 Methylmalonyl-CoA mutase [Methylocella silvestris BL2]
MTALAFSDAAGEAAWRAAVARIIAKSPSGALPAFQTDDAIPIAPLYPKADPAPQPWRAGNACRIIARLDHPDPFAAKALATADLEGGAGGLTISFEGAAAARGFGLHAQSAEDLNQALGGVRLDLISIRLEPAPGGVGAALQFADLIERRSHDPASIDVDFGFDPIGVFAARGGPPTNWKNEEAAVANACATLREHGFASPLMRADARPYNEAGATEAEELASVLATGVAYLRALAGAGQLAKASTALSFVLVTEADVLTGIAKLRALRQLWALVEKSCGVPSAPLRLHAETSWRMLTRRDVYGNLLRGALGCAAAMIGGADSVSVSPYTAALGLPDEFARRLARNTGAILLDESYLTRVADPTAGSGAIEALTVGLCEKAWDLFQRIETAGGFPKALASGFWQDTLALSRARRRQDFASRARALTGVSIFPDLGEIVPPVLSSNRRPAAASRSARGALPCQRDAEPFERLRDKSDAWLAAHGARPRIFLARLDANAESGARRDFARGVFEAAGFETAELEIFADLETLTDACLASGALAACLCPSEAAYAASGNGHEHVSGSRLEAAARELSAIGVRVVVASWPGEFEGALRRAGVEDFIFAGSNAVSFLRRIWNKKPRA